MWVIYREFNLSCRNPARRFGTRYVSVDYDRDCDLVTCVGGAIWRCGGTLEPNIKLNFWYRVACFHITCVAHCISQLLIVLCSWRYCPFLLVRLDLCVLRLISNQWGFVENFCKCEYCRCASSINYCLNRVQRLFSLSWVLLCVSYECEAPPFSQSYTRGVCRFSMRTTG